MASAQSRLNVEANWVTAFTNVEIENWSQTARHNKVSGYQLVATYSYFFEKYGVEARTGGGVKELSIEGTSGINDFSAETARLVLLLGADYHVDESFRLGLDLVAENNRDFVDFRTSTTDLLRYNLQLRGNYKIYKGVSLLFYYSKVMYPNIDLYFLTNPDHQFGIGLHFNFLKL
jgi:hypothetical protein